MNVALREFKEPDMQRLEEWARRIDSRKYMSLHRPSVPEATTNDPGLGVFWFVIEESGADVGTIWLEPARDPSELVLGILLGDESLLGRGIGSKAIGLAVERIQSVGQYRAVRLNVRSNNRRAIACYRKAGFMFVKEGVKETADGLVQYITMLRPLEQRSGVS